MVIKTGFTKWETIYRIRKVFHFHISKRVSAYDAANIVHRVGRCQKLLVGWDVRALSLIHISEPTRRS